ncbi:TonB-dependent receptor [Robertkochia sp. 1368]|nr:TonB-dependent receptor [Robertkochia sediminum]
MLTTAMAFGQEAEPVAVDTTQNTINTLGAVILYGNKLQDPVMSTEHYDYMKRVVQPRNVADMFNNLNGFSLVKRGNYAIDPSFRAAQYEQLNVQFDGGTKVMHACPNRMDPITTHVVPESIENIQVIKGPYSVRYGANFGGVINLVSKRPDRNERGLQGSFSTGYEGNGNSHVEMLHLAHVGKQFDISLEGTYRDFGNYEDGDGTEIPSAFRSTDYAVHTGYAFTPNDYLQLKWRQSFGRDVLHAALPMDTEEDNSSMISLDYTRKNVSEKVSNLHAKAYYSYVDHIMTNALRPSFMMTEAVAAVEATTMGGKVEVTWSPVSHLKVFSGVDAQLVFRDGGRTRMVKRNMAGDLLPEPRVFNDKVWQDSYVNDYGLFSEGNWQLSNDLTLTTGIRYDIVASDIRDPEADFAALYPELDQRTEYNLSGTASLKYRIQQGMLLEVAYGRGMRSANMIERYINHFTVGQDPYEYVGNPNLDAEVNNQVEVALRGKVEPAFKGLHAFNYGVSGYYSRFENYIVAVIDPELDRKYMPMAQPSEVKRFTNLDKAYKYGAEAEVGFELTPELSLNGFMAYVYTRNEDLGESLPLTPPLRSRVQFMYEGKKYWLGIDQNFVSAQDEIAPSFGETSTPAYQTTDIRAGVKPWKGISLGVAALNLFDETYSDHLNFSFVNQQGFQRTPITDPGRNISVFLQYRF